MEGGAKYFKSQARKGRKWVTIGLRNPRFHIWGGWIYVMERRIKRY